ncbi:DUF5690 family protein [Caulobacter sp. 602-1]|uniref:DUF5690 family protein n=1 Tax=Caulobacter sp. 602-1 TaxID=2492472 RepID=UPI000F641479|nr:DUF5690 family protein [Caulobacter sp. 602-1]RRN64052.1 hypothetical protein EIK80_14965 [Caulobacter sp. 602-1]
MTTGPKRWLERANPLAFTLFAGLAGFCAYFSMYAFRKPFAAATFGVVEGWNFAVDYKIALVLAQVAGYALSKMIGVKVISEIAPRHRGGAILGLIGLSWLALLAFAVTPAPWNVAALFLNGLPLGMIWGLVFGFMEGRRTSEVLGAILCASFILSSGVVKSVGKWLMVDLHVSPFWMPAATGAIFMPLLAVSVWALVQMPPPSAADEAARVRREPMDKAQRRAFLGSYAPGVVLLVLAYILLTALRDFRDNFAAEIWTALGFGEASGVFTASELPVAVVSLAVMGAVMLVRDNLRALLVMHGVILAGFLVLGGSTLAFQAHMLTPLTWMVLTGAGLYMAYTPFNAMLFDRMIAFSGQVGTAGFLIYVADASGYLGSVALLVWRNFAMVDLDWLSFFVNSAYATSVVGAICTLFAGLYFLRRRKTSDSGQGAVAFAAPGQIVEP